MAEQEQTAVLDAEQTPAAVTEQTTEVAEAVAQAGAEAVEVGAEAASGEYDLSTQEGIMALRKSNPAFDAYVKQQVDSSFAAGKQNAEKQIRLERGTEDVSRAALDAYARKYGFELDENDRKELPLWVKANRDAERVNTARAFISESLDRLGLPDEERNVYVEQIDALADEPDRLEKIAKDLYEVGTQRGADSKVGNLTLDEVPKDSRLHSSIRAYMEAEIEKELEARASERLQVENPPPTPRGSVPAGGAERYRNMTPAELARLSPSDWADYTRATAGVS
jgi:uncharacterized protein (UPF0335 family)